MPQLQLPIFPAGVTEINNELAVQNRDGTVWYFHGHLPLFHHAEDDVQSFRLVTSEMIDSGTAKQQEIVKAFGVPIITVKRYAKLYRDHGTKGFFETRPHHSSASVLKGEVNALSSSCATGANATVTRSTAERAGSSGAVGRARQHDS